MLLSVIVTSVLLPAYTLVFPYMYVFLSTILPSYFFHFLCSDYLDVKSVQKIFYLKMKTPGFVQGVSSGHHVLHLQ